MVTISLEDDAPPIVRILGVTLRRAIEDAGIAATVAQMHGRVALRSTTDPQAATITFAKGDVSIAHGAAADADLTISADLMTMGRPDAPKPKVKGAVTHPKFALAVSKVLDAPIADGWRGAARRFWSWAEDRPTRPAALRIVCTDDDAELVLGDATAVGTADAFELHGPGWALASVLTGGDHLGAAVVEGRVNGVGDFATINRMVGLVLALMLGDD